LLKVGVIGAGNMGSGIAQRIAQEDIQVVMVDTEPGFVERGMESIRKTLEEGVGRRIFTPERVEEILGNVTGTTDRGAVSDADLVIEVIFEDMDAKKALFRELDAICEQKTVLASNTSSFSISELADSVKRKDRFVGLHFFYHPAKNRLLEIIPGEWTGDVTLELAGEFARAIGKTGISVKDAPGFAVNRFFVPWLNEAVRLHAEGISIPTIDETAKRVFNIGMGPFKLMNVTGIPIAYHSTVSLGNSLNGFYGPCDRLREQFESGEEWDLDGDVDDVSAGTVEDRLLGTVFTVACQLVQDGIASIEDTDRGAKIGLRWSSGPFEMMNAVGIDRAHDVVSRFAERYGELHVPENMDKQFSLEKGWNISYVDLVIDGPIARVIFNRPEALNSINETVMKQLDERFAEAESTPGVEAIVLEGAGKAFVAGADIGYFIEKIDSGEIDDIIAFTSFGHEVLKRIDGSDRLVIAKLDGLAMGGGTEITLAADTIVATERGSMALPETGIGIYPGLGGTQRTTKYIGRELTKYLVLTGKPLDPETARAIGLVEYVFPASEVDERITELVRSGSILTKASRGEIELPDDLRAIKEHFANAALVKLLSGDPSLDETGSKLAKTISRKAPIAVKIANTIIDEGADIDLDDALQLELDHLSEIFRTKDAYEGLSSVLERRRPSFTGE